MTLVQKWLIIHYQFLFLIVLAAIIVYIPFLNAPFISDDMPSIVNHPLLGTWQYIMVRPHSFVQPLLYNIIFKIGGLNPLLFRLPNVLTHIANALLVYAVITLMKNRIVALYTAMLFAVHPILTESVTWISGGNYDKGAFFFLLSFLFYLLANKNKRMYLCSVFFFALCLFSLDKAIILPAVFLLYEFLFHNKRDRYIALLPFLIMGAIFVVVYALQLGARLGFLETIHYAQQDSIYNYNQLLQVPIAVTMYLQLIALPISLTMYHTEVVSYFEVAVRSLVLFLFLGFAFFWYKKDRLIFFWLAFFFITLIPTLLPLGVGSSVAERYVYLGSIGIFFLAGSGLYYLQKNYSRPVVIAVFSVVIIVLSIRTILRNNDYTSFENFWLSTVHASPVSYQAHNNVGIIYAQKGQFDKALQEFEQALQIVPNSAQPYQNIGSVFFTEKKYDEAIKYYGKALSLNPNLWVSNQNIAAIYFGKKDYKKAEEYTKKALAIVPGDTHLMTNLALIYIKEKKLQLAKQVLNQILQLDPTNQQAQSTLEKL